jgi:hypothetical protein
MIAAPAIADATSLGHSFALVTVGNSFRSLILDAPR